MKGIEMRKSYLTLAFLLANSVVAFAQGSAITVTSSGSPDYHFIVNGAPYFPLGWYDAKDLSALEAVRSSGGNIVFTYTGGLLQTYPQNTGDPGYVQYINALKVYLGNAASKGLKVIVDLDGNGYGSQGDYFGSFTTNEIRSIVSNVANYPAVFGWYLSDEPYSRASAEGNGFPTPTYLQYVHDAVRSIETSMFGGIQRHPVFPVICNPQFFAAYNDGKGRPPYYPTSYDAVGWDCYVYSTEMDTHWNGSDKWDDYNNVSRFVASRAMAQVRQLNKEAFVMVAQAEDKLDPNGVHFRKLSLHDVVYESMSPIIHGARGLLYYWWNPDECSAETKNNVNTFMSFFTRNSLADVIMRGTDFDCWVRNFSIDGYSHNLSDYTWKNYNNGDPTQDPSIYGFVQFTQICLSYNGQLYLFAVNDFKNVIRTDLLIEPPTGTVPYQVTQLNADGTTASKVITCQNAALNWWKFTDTFGSYDVKVYRIATRPGSPPGGKPLVALSGNYPDPFNPTTTVRYFLGKDSHVTVAVYDVLGRRVAELVNSAQQAGDHEVHFDGTRLGSGVYFCRVTANGQSVVKKMVLAK